MSKIPVTQMADALRDAVQKAIDVGSATLLGLEKETGVQRASIARFLAKKQTLRLDLAAVLASHFRLVLRPTSGTKQARQAARIRKLRKVADLAGEALAAIDAGDVKDARELLV